MRFSSLSVEVHDFGVRFSRQVATARDSFSIPNEWHIQRQLRNKTNIWNKPTASVDGREKRGCSSQFDERTLTLKKMFTISDLVIWRISTANSLRIL